MNEVDNRTVCVDYPNDAVHTSGRADRDEMTMELATQLVDEVRLKARAERLAADLVRVCLMKMKRLVKSWLTQSWTLSCIYVSFGEALSSETLLEEKLK